MGYIKKFDFKKLIKDLLGIISIPFLLYGITIVLTIKKVIGDDLIKILGIDIDKGPYYLLSDIIGNSRYGDVVLTILLILLIAFLLIVIIYYIVNNFHERLLMIEHNSLNQVNFKINKNDIDEYILKKYRINQYDIFHNKELLSEDRIISAIASTKKHINHIRENIKNGYSLGYAGIANIPITFMLGYEVGDENSCLYFHQRRKAGEKKYFDKVKKQDYIETLNLTCEKPNDALEPGKLLLIISMSKRIEDQHFKDVIEDNDYIISFSTNNINYDVITSLDQIEDYIDTIFKYITPIEAMENITEIKICMATPSIFIYALASKFSKTQDKDIVIYHFEGDTYPWGININKGVPVINNLSSLE